MSSRTRRQDRETLRRFKRIERKQQREEKERLEKLREIERKNDRNGPSDSWLAKWRPRDGFL